MFKNRIKIEIVFFDGTNFAKQHAELCYRNTYGITSNGESYSSHRGGKIEVKWHVATAEEFRCARFKVIIAESREAGLDVINKIPEESLNFSDNPWDFLHIIDRPAHIYTWSNGQVEGILFDGFVDAWIEAYKPPQNSEGGTAGYFYRKDYSLYTGADMGYGSGAGDFRSKINTLETPSLPNIEVILLGVLYDVASEVKPFQDGKGGSISGIKRVAKLFD